MANKNPWRPIPLTKDEELILGTIKEKGEFIWNGHNNPDQKKTLKELLWKGFIGRKQGTANVFIFDGHGEIVVEHNERAKKISELLNQ